MGHDEDMILVYLRKFPGAYISPMEVCKRADSRKRFVETPDWAKPLLAKMTSAGALQVNAVGHYRIKVNDEEEEPEEKERREVSTMTMEEAMAAAAADAAANAQ